VYPEEELESSICGRHIRVVPAKSVVEWAPFRARTYYTQPFPVFSDYIITSSHRGAYYGSIQIDPRTFLFPRSSQYPILSPAHSYHTASVVYTYLFPPAPNNTHSHTSQLPILHKHPLKSQSQYPTPAITVSSDQPSSHRHAFNAAVSTHRRHQISCSFYDYTPTRLYPSLDIACCSFCGR